MGGPVPERSWRLHGLIAILQSVQTTILPATGPAAHVEIPEAVHLHVAVYDISLDLAIAVVRFRALLADGTRYPARWRFHVFVRA